MESRRVFLIAIGFCQAFRCSVTQLCLILSDPMDCIMLGFPILHHFLELVQTRVHRVGDATEPSHPLSSPSFLYLPQLLSLLLFKNFSLLFFNFLCHTI